MVLAGRQGPKKILLVGRAEKQLGYSCSREVAKNLPVEAVARKLRHAREALEPDQDDAKDCPHDEREARAVGTTRPTAQTLRRLLFVAILLAGDWSQRAEQAVLLAIDAGGEVQRGGGTGAAAIAKGQRP